jgi:hypothetical protein
MSVFHHNVSIWARKFCMRPSMDIRSEVSDCRVGTQLEGLGSPRSEAMFSWIGQLKMGRNSF